MPSLFAQEFDVSTDLDLQRRRQELSPDRHLSCTKPDSDEPRPGTWRDQLLADIEEHVAELRQKLARYAVFRSLCSSKKEMGADNEAVVEPIHQSIEDTAAAALASEMAYYEAFLRKPATVTQDVIAKQKSAHGQETQDDDQRH